MKRYVLIAVLGLFISATNAAGWKDTEVQHGLDTYTVSENTSINTVNLSFPNDKSQHGILIISHGLVWAGLERGGMVVCGENCDVDVEVDGVRETLKASNTMPSSGVLFSSRDFTKQMYTAKKVRLALSIYHAPDVVLEFDTTKPSRDMKIYLAKLDADEKEKAKRKAQERQCEDRAQLATESNYRDIVRQLRDMDCSFNANSVETQFGG